MKDTKKRNILLLNWTHNPKVKGGGEVVFETIQKIFDAKLITLDDVPNIPNEFKQAYHYSILDRNKFILDYVRDYCKVNKVDLIIRNSALTDLEDLPVPVINIFQDPYKDLFSFLKKNIPLQLQELNEIQYIEFMHFYPHLQKLTKGYNVANSEYMKKYMLEADIPCNEVIPLSVDPKVFNDDDYEINIDSETKSIVTKEELRKRMKIPMDKKVIMWVGQFHPNKWQLMPQIIKDNPDCLFLLFFKNVSWYKPVWAKNVKIFSSIPQYLMKDFYRMSDLHLSVSPVESFSLSTLESLYCNRPVVGFETGFLATTENPEKYGVVVKDWNAEAFNKAIKDVDISLKPRETALKEFNHERFVKAWGVAVDSVLLPKA